MKRWKDAARDALVSGTTASLLSTAALATCGAAEVGRPLAPTNAVSHWIWGDEALREDTPTLRHTIPGYLIHHGSAMFWSVLFERLCGRLLDRKEPAVTLGVGTAAAAVACFADYQLTPERFKPGFENHLSRPSLAVVYGAFGVGLAIGAMLCRRS